MRRFDSGFPPPLVDETKPAGPPVEGRYPNYSALRRRMKKESDLLALDREFDLLQDEDKRLFDQVIGTSNGVRSKPASGFLLNLACWAVDRSEPTPEQNRATLRLV